MGKNKEWNVQAKLVAPEEWARRVESLDESVRAKVASIVFWDHFGDRPYGHRWPHLDALLRVEIPDVPDDAIAMALMSVGYPVAEAARRANSNGRQNVSSNIQPEIPHSVGEAGLLCGVCHLVVEDVKILIARGVVLPDGSIRPGWPTPPHNGVVGYMHRVEVQDLLDWVLGGAFERELVSVGINVNFSKIIDAMGLHPKVRKVA